ncbi:MAG: tripartite tricarboxylate transporter substrate-binding protein [Burkholderiaceae bacterium]
MEKFAPLMETNIMKRLVNVLTLALLIPFAAQAQQTDSYPSRPVKIIVPWAVGGISDTLARKLGGELGKRLGQSFVVENKPGAAGNVGAALVARSQPDGYTLLLTVDTNITVNPVIYDKLAYDPLKDLTPIAMLSNMPMVLVTHPSTKATQISELMSQAKKSEPMTFGTSGAGSPAALLNEVFNRPLKKWSPKLRRPRLTCLWSAAEPNSRPSRPFFGPFGRSFAHFGRTEARFHA